MRGKRKEKKRLEKGNEAGLFDEHERSEQPRRITPVDIQQKEFRLAMRGYHERDVDEFLDQITEEVARLYAENKRLQEELTTKGAARLATGSGAAEAEDALRQARDEADRILAEAESRARMTIAAAAAPSAGSPGLAPTVTGAALAGFLSREKSFLQNLAKMMQDHANAMKEDVRRVRETATGGRAGGSTGTESLSGPETSAPEPQARRQPEAEHEPWRPQQSGPSPSASPAPRDMEEPPGDDRSSDRDQPPYFMGERSRSSEGGPGSAGAPTGGTTPLGETHEAGNPPVFDLMDVQQRQQLLEADPGPAQAQGREVEAEERPAFEAEAPPPVYEEAPPAANPSEEASSAPNRYVDEPTREWTLGEGAVDAGDAEDLIVRGHVPPVPRGRRWSPPTEDEAPGDDRSIKELFWGED